MNIKNFFKAICWTLALGSAGASAAEDLTIKQRILMPGQVHEVHAEFEAECEKCHESFNKAGLTKLCLDCHDDINDDRLSKSGFHGQSPLASTKSCNTCHADHLGRDADIINMQVDSFSHDHTRFPLEGKHVPLDCVSCHEPEEKFREAEAECIACHKEDDFHKGALGEECDTCHTPQGWQTRLKFDHSETDFPLKGEHQEVACASCHAGQVYEFEETTCISCHKAADVHAGKNGTECETCHSVDGWDKRIFDHSTTDFPLLDKHGEIPCRACHTNGVVEETTPTECHGCHADDDVHLGRNGEQCESCHKTSDWSAVKFNHAKETDFPLTGLHKDLVCTECHSGALSDELPRDCASCHAADDPHKTPEMEVCATCHTTEGWRIISRFDHDFTMFPLVGIHQIVACESCHVNGQFIGTPTECVACHKADDHHKGALGDNCSTCHTPNAWNIWRFDHEKQTGYPLLGAHKDAACASCHVPGRALEDTPTVCGKCHEQQDIHNGGFGLNCGRCHSQDQFFDLILQD